MLRNIFITAVVSFMLINISSAQDEEKKEPIKPNKKVQSFLRILSSANPEIYSELFPDTMKESEFKLKLIELQKEAGGAKELVEQLMYFRVHAKSMREAMMPLVVMEKLNISDDDMVSGILPFLKTDDKTILSEVYDWLGAVDYCQKTKRYDFGQYEKVIQEKKSDVPFGLVKYMYIRSPVTALSTLASIYLNAQAKEALIDQVKGSGEEQGLKRLSKRQEWWIQLYVAAMIKKKPDIQNPSILNRLRKSENPLVHEFIKDIEQKASRKS